MMFSLTAAALVLAFCSREPQAPAVAPIDSAEASAAAASLICEAAELAQVASAAA